MSAPNETSRPRDSMSTMISESGAYDHSGFKQKEQSQHLDASPRPNNPRLNSAMVNGTTSDEHALNRLKSVKSRQGNNEDANLDNPLIDYTAAELVEMGQSFAKDKGLLNLSYLKDKKRHFRAHLGKNRKDAGDEKALDEKQVDASDMKEGLSLWAKAALVAQNPTGFEGIEGLTEEDRAVLRNERDNKWSQPFELYRMVIMASVAAAVQGMDESVISGAQLRYPEQFGIGSGTGRDAWLEGLINAAPYLCCAVIGCWLTDPLNYRLGRRGTIFVTAMFSFITCIWSACTDTWWHLFIARFFLGFGIGPKSATVPVYSAECSPAPIRGALVMMWQMWTAFGIMIGYVADLAFYYVPDKPHIRGLNWRLMLGSAGFPAIVVAAQVWFSPESPRWLISKGHYDRAFKSMYRLRGHELLAAREIFYIHVLLQEEEAVAAQTGNRWIELFTLPRVRRATLASTIVMFGQQFCGVNAIVYYTSTIFTQAGFGEIQALLASWGFGMLNFIGALPAVYTIDTFGRRSLLLLTFPLMCFFLLLTGFAFFIPDTSKARIAVVSLGIYLYCIVYSVGEGPVPFTYSAEVYPLSHREIGMSWSTAVLWGFNFIVAITFPSLLSSFKPQGAFGWYAAWNAILFVLILLFVPETKGLTLEELDYVFSVPTEKHAKYALKQVPWFFRRHVMGSKVPQEPLYHFNKLENRNTYVDKQEIGHVERKQNQLA